MTVAPCIPSSVSLHPKQPRRRIQLRDANHALLTNAQELQALKAFCVDLFQPQQPPILAHNPAPPCQLTVEEIYGSLTQLKAGKAVPRHLAPAVAWKGAADIMAPMLAHCFNLSAASGRYHNTWTDSWVAWLAKPHKTPDRPAHLRPIALQDAGGKSIAKALQVQAAHGWPMPLLRYPNTRMSKVASWRPQSCAQLGTVDRSAPH